MTKIDLPGPLYDIAGAAEYLGLSPSTVRWYVYGCKDNPLVPDAHVGKRPVFTQATLDALKRRPQGWPREARKGRIKAEDAE